MTSSDCFVAWALLLAVSSSNSVAFAQRTAADIESARELYNQGLALRDRGDLRGALEKLKAAHALGNTPITGTDLCKTFAMLRQPVEARETCLSVGRLPITAAESARAQQARVEATRIAEDEKPKIASVRVTLSGVPRGRDPTVFVDGALVPPLSLSQFRAVNPGAHELVARVGAGAESRASFEVREGEAKEITLIVQAPPAEAPQPAGTLPPPQQGPAPRESPKKGSALFVTGLVIAGVGAAVGAGAGITAMSGKNDLEKKCIDNICGREDHAALDRANTWATVSTTFFVIGGVGLALSLVGLISDSRKTSSGVKAHPSFGLGNAGVSGAF